MTRIQRQRSTFFKNDHEHLNKKTTKRIENYYRLSKEENNRNFFKKDIERDEAYNIASHIQIGSYHSI